MSGQTVYNWEQGAAKPRAEQRATLASLRGIGKREAQPRLQKLNGKASGNGARLQKLNGKASGNGARLQKLNGKASGNGARQTRG